MKKFNLLISAQSAVQQSKPNEKFPKEYDDLRVTDLRKIVIKAVMSDTDSTQSPSTGEVPTILMVEFL